MKVCKHKRVTSLGDNIKKLRCLNCGKLIRGLTWYKSPLNWWVNEGGWSPHFGIMWNKTDHVICIDFFKFTIWWWQDHIKIIKG